VETSPLKTERTFGVLLALAVPVFFLWLGANSIWDANEAFYVDTPRQMVLSGDYVTPIFNGAERLNKPVLSYWVVAALYNLLGISVTTERIGIAIGVLGIVGMAFLIGRALRSTTTGVIAALIVATAPQVVMWGRRIFIDVYITLFMSIALACFVLAERHPEYRRRYLLLMYLAIGLGVLTKGPVGIVLPALTCAIWLAVERRWADVNRLMILPGLAIVLVTVAPWYVALVIQHGWAPVTGFFIGENLDRFTTSMQPDNREIWFYVPVLFGGLFPWAPLVVVPLVTAWRRALGDHSPSQGAIRRLLWIWIVAIVATFSLSQTKQDLYILPVTVAVAALVADRLVAREYGKTDRALRTVFVCVAVLSGAAGLAIVRYFGSGGYYELDGARFVGVLLAVSGVACVGLVIAGRHRPAVVVMAASFVLFNYVFAARTLPSIERLKPVVPLAETFLRRASPQAELGAYEFMLPSLVYYAGRPVTLLESLDVARAFYANPRGAWAIMDEGRYETLRLAVPHVCVAGRRPRLDPKLADVLAGRPPEDVLLVTNECGDARPATN
jgi:4-amino-4-deoxy-L-arabinose transferase-like glycosyltransferase